MQHEYFQLLIQAAQRGRKNAFIDLCELNAKKIYTLCVRMLANKKLADLLTVEIFLQAWNNIKFIREDTAFDLWLKSIAIYTILEEIRTKKFSGKLTFSTEDTELNVKDKIESALLNLPEKSRIMFIMNEIEGYTFEEISDFFYEYSPAEIKELIRETRHKLVESIQ